MDSDTPSFRKDKTVKLSKCLATFLFLIFLGCIGATGLLVYHFSSRSHITTIQTADQLICNGNHENERNYSTSEVTTLGPTEIQTNYFPNQETSTEKQKTEELDVRLPKEVFPHYYELKLIPFIYEGNFTFHGEVTILVNVSKDSRNITLHVEDLIIDKVNVYENEQNRRKFLGINRLVNESSVNFLIIHLNEFVKAGKQYYIHIYFKGILNDLLVGFYRSSYQVNNQTRWIAATQFESTEARKAFPCFDEPAFKARFQISIARFNNMSTISNMRIVKTDPMLGLPDFVWDHYEETLPMSSYLLAFVISDFESIRNGSFAIYARHSALAQSQYSLKIGPPILRFFEEFFGIEYPLPKTDMIALPDFSAGAMENWGLITYRESILLYQEGISSKLNLQKIAQCVAHELAHQWFGNLVTPSWWSDLWLNEGFACYAEYLGANSVSPEWKLLDQFVINNLQKSFTLDSLNSSHPISANVNNPEEITNIFDEISYSKGASVIRMMQHFLTTEVFQKALKKYLSSKMYSNAEQDDLWMFMTKQSHEDNVLDKNITVKDIMDTWTLQANYPVVTAIRNYNNRTLFLNQEIFTFNSTKDNDLKYWWVPVTYIDDVNPTTLLWLPPQKGTVIHQIETNASDWLLANVNQTGYYRVNYDLNNWMLITKQLLKSNGHVVFDPKNRAQLIDDSFNLASAGYLEYHVALNITKYLYQEREYVPWNAAISNLVVIEEIFIRTPHFGLFKNYVLQLISPFYGDLGLNEKYDDDQLVMYNRIQISSTACRLGLRSCVGHAVQHFQNWKNTLDPDTFNDVPSSLREIVYCTAIRVGDQEEWDFVWDRYLNANVANDKDILLSALSCSGEVWILQRYLERSITENSGIRKQDVPRVFHGVLSNVIGKGVAYKFLKDNFGRMLTYFGSSSMLLDTVIKLCTGKFLSKEEIVDFKKFVKEQNSVGLVSATITQSIEQGELNVQWVEKNFNNVLKWLESYR